MKKLKAFIPHYFRNDTLLKWLDWLKRKVSKKRVEKNRERNETVLLLGGFYLRDTDIEEQSDWKLVKFGSFSMAWSGCEIIATYNALLSLGRHPDETDMVELIAWYERNGAVLRGLFGVSPRAVFRYFTESGYDAFLTTETDGAVVNHIGRTYDTVILTVYNDADDITAQIHTVNVSKDKNGFYLHNGYKKKLIAGKPVYAAAGPYPNLCEVIGDMAAGNASLICAIGIRAGGNAG